jgi:hypothetical protein
MLDFFMRLFNDRRWSFNASFSIEASAASGTSNMPKQHPSNSAYELRKRSGNPMRFRDQSFERSIVRLVK